MNKKPKQFTVMLVFAALLTNYTADAQTNFKIGDSHENCIELSGTSTFADWSMMATEFSGGAVFIAEPGYSFSGLQELNFSLPVKKLKSGKSRLDKNAYKALRSSAYKTIDYKLTSAKITGNKDYKYNIETIGSLTVAGITREINVTMSCTPNKNHSITCEGNFYLKMSDYNVEPPTFFDGMMSTSESVKINFAIRFER